MNPPISVVSERDMCLQRHWKQTSNGDYQWFMKSIANHPKDPKKASVRATVNVQAAYISNSNSNCTFTMISHVDIGGWVPSYVISKLQAAMANELARKFHETAIIITQQK